jgi:hypothetical protein
MSEHTSTTVSGQRHLAPETIAWAWWLAIAGAVGIGLAFVIGLLPGQSFGRFLLTYLLNFCFFLSISLGALFFVIIQHLTRAGWSVAVRRLAECLMAPLPLWGLLFLPILLLLLVGDGSLYVWNDAEHVRGDELLQLKQPYLNAPFFAVRALIYLGLWAWMARFFWQRSLAQDQTGDKRHTLSMQRWSGPATLAFGGTVSFAAFDWLMSLEPHWFSTIFGVYFFAGCVVAFFAALALLAAVLQQRGRLQDAITPEHYHDIGKWLFGFVVFWAYIAFSQYMLIWYANIPEETIWFRARQTDGWTTVSLLLLFGHFLIPFCGLLSRRAKRNKLVLAAWAVWLLVMHWVDLYWLAVPRLGDGGPSLGFADAFCAAGMGALFLAIMIRAIGDRNLLPAGDPRLDESLAFENV